MLKLLMLNKMSVIKDDSEFLGTLLFFHFSI